MGRASDVVLTRAHLRIVPRDVVMLEMEEHAIAAKDHGDTGPTSRVPHDVRNETVTEVLLGWDVLPDHVLEARNTLASFVGSHLDDRCDPEIGLRGIISSPNTSPDALVFLSVM